MKEIMGDAITLTLLSLVIVIITAICRQVRNDRQRRRELAEMRRHFSE